MDRLVDYILTHEDWLMQRILNYATTTGYTKYTSTLVEAWRLSISGLSDSFKQFIESIDSSYELSPHIDYCNDPASQFGIEEAKKHRERGISLAMFLGLMKYYRQTYHDLINESDFTEKGEFNSCLKRFFDRIEIAFCSKWVESNADEKIKELQKSNRKMTNDKNRYLTIFESYPSPVLLLDTKHDIVNMNKASAKFFKFDQKPPRPYDPKNRKIFVFEVIPWIKESLINFAYSEKETAEYNMSAEIDYKRRDFRISMGQMLDVSRKFEGTVLIIEDVTDFKAKEKLEAVVETIGATCHEMNNPLQAVIGNLDLMRMRLDMDNFDKDKFLSMIGKAGEASGRITDIIEKLMNLKTYQTKKYLSSSILDVENSIK